LRASWVGEQLRLGLIDEDEEVHEVTDRGYWEKRAGKATLAMADELLQVVRKFDPTLGLKYNKFYIGLAKNGQPTNFVVFRPKKEWLRVEPRLDRSDELQAWLEQEGLDVMDYDQRWGRYRIRLSRGYVKKHDAFIREFLKRAYEESLT
jgi:hypothetical protein